MQTLRERVLNHLRTNGGFLAAEWPMEEVLDELGRLRSEGLVEIWQYVRESRSGSGAVASIVASLTDRGRELVVGDGRA